MNPIEWLVYAAAWEFFCRPWGQCSTDVVMASAQVIAEGDRRSG